MLSDPPEGAASLAAIELGVDDERRLATCDPAQAGAVAGQLARLAFGPSADKSLEVRHSRRSRRDRLSGRYKERWLACASLGEGGVSPR